MFRYQRTSGALERPELHGKEGNDPEAKAWPDAQGTNHPLQQLCGIENQLNIRQGKQNQKDEQLSDDEKYTMERQEDDDFVSQAGCIDQDLPNMALVNNRQSLIYIAAKIN